MTSAEDGNPYKQKEQQIGVESDESWSYQEADAYDLNQSTGLG